MAWEWLTAGVVPGLSVAGALWTARQQRLSSDRQITAQQESTTKQLEEQRRLASDAQDHDLRKAREERTWERREAMVRDVVRISRQIIEGSPAEVIVHNFHRLKELLPEADLYVRPALRDAIIELHNVADFVYKDLLSDVMQLETARHHKGEAIDAMDWELAASHRHEEKRLEDEVRQRTAQVFRDLDVQIVQVTGAVIELAREEIRP